MDREKTSSLHEVAIDRQQLRIVLDLAAHLMDMQGAKIGAELALAFWTNVGKVLIAENNDSSLRCQESQLILLLGGEGAELYTTDLSANGRRQLLELRPRSVEQRLLFRIGPKAHVDMLKLL